MEYPEKCKINKRNYLDFYCVILITGKIQIK